MEGYTLRRLIHINLNTLKWRRELNFIDQTKCYTEIQKIVSSKSLIDIANRTLLLNILKRKRIACTDIDRTTAELLHMLNSTDIRSIHTELNNVRALFTSANGALIGETVAASIISDDVQKTAEKIQQLTEVMSKPVMDTATNQTDEELLEEFLAEERPAAVPKRAAPARIAAFE